MQDPDGFVAEGSAENIFLVQNGVISTPDVTSALDGITRRTVMQLAQEAGYKVVERRITRDELYICDEAWFCGTGVQIAPITRIEHRPVGDGKIGPVVSDLREVYFDVVRGRNQKYRHWCTPVYAPVPVAEPVPAH